MKYTYSIYFLKNKNPISVFAWLIRVANKRPYNHIEVVAVPDSFITPARFYGSVYPKSRLASTDYVQGKYKLIKILKLKDSKHFSDEENLKWLDSMCGKPYSKTQIVVQLLSAVSIFTKQALSDTVLNWEHNLICVELGARFMVERMGYKIDKSFDACQFKDIEDAKEGE